MDICIKFTENLYKESVQMATKIYNETSTIFKNLLRLQR